MTVLLDVTEFPSIVFLGRGPVDRLLQPNGVPSGLTVGGGGIATATVAPSSIVDGDIFGQVTVTKKGWVFRPPVNTYQWRLFKEYEGVSLLREGGVWSEVAHPDLERTRAAQKYLGGGRDHVVGDALKIELEGLGYTVSEEVVTTEEYL